MNKKLKQLRTEIDYIDCKIISLLYERFLLIEKVYKFKCDNNIDIEDIERETLVLKKLLCKKIHYDQKKYIKYITSIYRNIFKNSKLFQYNLNKDKVNYE